MGVDDGETKMVEGMNFYCFIFVGFDLSVDGLILLSFLFSLSTPPMVFFFLFFPCIGMGALELCK